MRKRSKKFIYCQYRVEHSEAWGHHLNVLQPFWVFAQLSCLQVKYWAHVQEVLHWIFASSNYLFFAWKVNYWDVNRGSKASLFVRLLQSPIIELSKESRASWLGRDFSCACEIDTVNRLSDICLAPWAGHDKRGAFNRYRRRSWRF